MQAAMRKHLFTAEDEAGLLDVTARIAENGASVLYQQQQSILSGADQANRSGFAVGEDWLATDAMYAPGSVGWYARQPTAQSISADLRTQAAAFAAQETQTAVDMVQAAGDLGGEGAVRRHIQAVGNRYGPLPLDSGAAQPSAPEHGKQPQIGPFPLPPKVAAAAPAGPPKPPDPTGGLLSPSTAASSAVGGDPVTKLLEKLADPGPQPVLTPDEVRRLADAQVQARLNDVQRFNLGQMIRKAIGGCAIGGVGAGIGGLITGPADLGVIGSGCIGGAVTGAGDYVLDHIK
jgi:hypothetical protein